MGKPSRGSLKSHADRWRCVMEIWGKSYHNSEYKQRYADRIGSRLLNALVQCGVSVKCEAPTYSTRIVLLFRLDGIIKLMAMSVSKHVTGWIKKEGGLAFRYDSRGYYRIDGVHI